MQDGPNLKLPLLRYYISQVSRGIGKWPGIEVGSPLLPYRSMDLAAIKGADLVTSESESANDRKSLGDIPEASECCR
jgi:hypothetical protein